jgi:Zn-finger nucleic acid-binding protein
MRNVGFVICPKCQNVMQTVDRRGVHIEQCQGCKGIFLDRGELEQISSAEQSFYTAGPPPYQGGYGSAPQPYRDSPPPYRGGGYDPRYQQHGYRDSPPPHGHKRRRGFLEELFD